MQDSTSPESRGSVLSGLLWMFLVSLLLFWLPGIGTLIAGIVGGVKAGGVANGLTAAIVPGFMLGGVLFVFASALTGMPVIGAVAGMGGFFLALLALGPLLLGAVVGGLLA